MLDEVFGVVRDFKSDGLPKLYPECTIPIGKKILPKHEVKPKVLFLK